MFSVGTGYCLLRNLDGSWSNPVACGVAGVGFGILIGAALKDVVGVLSRLEANNVEANQFSLSLGQKLDDVSLSLSLLQCLAGMRRVGHATYSYFSKKSPCGECSSTCVGV
jgi:lipid-binding SYLF domain-containing protein